MTTKHKCEPEIIAYLNIKGTDEKDRRKLRKEAAHFIISGSNQAYNNEVLVQNKGKIIPFKKGASDANEETHIKCTVCGAVISKKNFNRHSSTCKTRQKLLFGTEKRPNGSLILPPVADKFSVFESKVLNTMQKDEISKTIHEQDLILEYGRRFFMGHRADNQCSYVSSKVRTLATLFLKMKEKDSSLEKFENCLEPSNFDTLMRTVREWSDYNEEEGRCGVASVPRRICKSLKVCSELLWSKSLKDKLLSSKEKNKDKTRHEEFIHLMNSDWANELGCIGDLSIKKNKMVKLDKMPSVDDVVKYFEELSKIINSTMETLNTEIGCNDENYHTLVKAALAFLVAFNGRRPGEVSNATLDNYKSLQKKTNSNDGDDLSVFMVTATKNDTRVPIIVPKTILMAINDIVKFKSHFKMPGNLLFPSKDGSAYNGSHLISVFKNKMPLQNPKDVTANGFRHFWATETQKNPTIKQHMPKFLGHSDSVHKKFYELPHSDIHLDLIGPYLQEKTRNAQGNANNCVGTSVQSNCDGTLPENEDQFLRASEVGLPGKSTNIKVKKVKTRRSARNRKQNLRRTSKMELGETSENEEENLFSDNTSEDPDFDLDTTPKKGSLKKRTNVCQIQVDYSSSDSSSDCGKEHFNPTKRTKWNTPEKKELFEGLPATVLGLRTAGRGNVKKFWERTKVIKHRHSLQLTRIELSKYYTKKKKVPTPIKNALLENIQNN